MQNSIETVLKLM